LGLVGDFVCIRDGAGIACDSIPSLRPPCACKTHIPSLEVCLDLNLRSMSFACVNSLAGSHEFSESGYPFHLTRYCVLFLFLVGRSWRISSIL
jgi:hypothetical protein